MKLKILFFLFFLIFLPFACSESKLIIKINPKINVIIEKVSFSEPISGIAKMLIKINNQSNTPMVIEPIVEIGNEKIFLPKQFFELNEKKEIIAILDQSLFQTNNIQTKLKIKYTPIDKLLKNLSGVVSKKSFYSFKNSFVQKNKRIKLNSLEKIQGLIGKLITSQISVTNQTKTKKKIIVFSPTRQDFFFTKEFEIEPSSRKSFFAEIMIPVKSDTIIVKAVTDEDEQTQNILVEAKTALPSNVLWFFQRNSLYLLVYNFIFLKFL